MAPTRNCSLPGLQRARPTSTTAFPQASALQPLREKSLKEAPEEMSRFKLGSVGPQILPPIPLQDYFHSLTRSQGNKSRNSTHLLIHPPHAYTASGTRLGKTVRKQPQSFVLKKPGFQAEKDLVADCSPSPPQNTHSRSTTGISLGLQGPKRHNGGSYP